MLAMISWFLCWMIKRGGEVAIPCSSSLTLVREYWLFFFFFLVVFQEGCLKKGVSDRFFVCSSGRAVVCSQQSAELFVTVPGCALTSPLTRLPSKSCHQSVLLCSREANSALFFLLSLFSQPGHTWLFLVLSPYYTCCPLNNSELLARRYVCLDIQCHHLCW